MPEGFPVSRYLLVGIAILMLGAALPDAHTLLQQVRRNPAMRMTDRIVYIDAVQMR
jgi:hypothetical protein